MSGITYGIGRGLSRRDLYRMHKAALSVIERTGVRVTSPRIMKRISGAASLEPNSLLIPKLCLHHVH